MSNLASLNVSWMYRRTSIQTQNAVRRRVFLSGPKVAMLPLGGELVWKLRSKLLPENDHFLREEKESIGPKETIECISPNTSTYVTTDFRMALFRQYSAVRCGKTTSTWTSDCDEKADIRFLRKRFI